MNYKNLIKIALKALANNKFRGFLTMLGIIIGVASVIAMLAIGQGSKRSIREQISEMGSNMIMVHPGNGRFGGVRQSASSMQTLKLEDYRTIEREASYISACSPTVSSSGQAIYGANNAPTTLYGVNGDYMTIRKYSVGEGEMFTDHDVKTAAKVCVVGKTVVDNLFVSGEDPLGKTIRFDKIPLKIVGVLSSKGYNSMGQDQDDLIDRTLHDRTETGASDHLPARHLPLGPDRGGVGQGDRRNRRNSEAEPQDQARRRGRFRDSLAGRAQFDAQLDHRPDDGAAGLHSGHLPAGGRYRHHEHHVRLGNRAHARNRPAECRSARKGGTSCGNS